MTSGDAKITRKSLSLCGRWELVSLQGRLYCYSTNLWILTGLVIVLQSESCFFFLVFFFFRQVQWELHAPQQEGWKGNKVRATKGRRFLQDSVWGSLVRLHVATDFYSFNSVVTQHFPCCHTVNTVCYHQNYFILFNYTVKYNFFYLYI